MYHQHGVFFAKFYRLAMLTRIIILCPIYDPGHVQLYDSIDQNIESSAQTTPNNNTSAIPRKMPMATLY